MSIGKQGNGYRSKQSNVLVELTLSEGKHIRLHAVERDHKWGSKAKVFVLSERVNKIKEPHFQNGTSVLLSFFN